MSRIADLTAAGYAPLQDHRPNIDIAMRIVSFGCRVVGRDQYDRYQVVDGVDDSLGDLLCASFRKPAADRPIGGWAHSWPVLLTADPTVVSRDPRSSARPWTIPILGDWIADRNFIAQPQGVTSRFAAPMLPVGSAGISIAGTDHQRQRDMFLGAWEGRLAAPWAAGDPRMATRVYDLTPEHGHDELRNASLSTIFRAVRVPMGNVVALSGADQWEGPVIAGRMRQQGVIEARPTGEHALGILMGERGVFTMGGVAGLAPGDLYPRTQDGYRMRSLRILTSAYFTHPGTPNMGYEGPLAFELDIAQPYTPLPHRARGHIVYENQRWVVECETDFRLVSERPPTPPVRPRDPNSGPPPDPRGPVAPPIPGAPGVPGGPGAPGGAPPNQPGAPGAPGAPAQGRGPQQGGGLMQGGGRPQGPAIGPIPGPIGPGIVPVAGPGPGPAGPGGGPAGFGGAIIAGPGGPDDLPPPGAGADTAFGGFADSGPVGGATPVGGGAGLSGSGGISPQPPRSGAIYSTGGSRRPWSTEQGKQAILTSSHPLAVADLLLRPVQTGRGGSGRQVDDDLSPDQVDAVAPITAKLAAYAASTGPGGYAYTQRPCRGRYPGGTASGGLVLLPPEADVRRMDPTLVGQARSAPYLVAGPGARLAAGTPDLATGAITLGGSMRADGSGNFVTSRHPTGTPAGIDALRVEVGGGLGLSTDGSTWGTQTTTLTAARTWTWPDKSGTVALTSDVNKSALYGDGADGTVTINAPTTLTRDMYYANLTIDGATLDSGGYRVFVRDTLAFTGASPTIAHDGSAGAAGGGAGAAATAGSLGGSAIGGAGNVGAGGAGGATTNSTGSAGGAAGAGSAGAGGAAGTVTAPAAAVGGVEVLHANPSAALGRDLAAGLLYGGSGGGGGGGDGVISGGGGGGGGGVVVVCARLVTGGGVIAARGGAGGSPAAGNAGGGGGGGGGTVVLISDSAPTITPVVSGGAGGTGFGTGGVGTAGSVGRSYTLTP